MLYNFERGKFGLSRLRKAGDSQDSAGTRLFHAVADDGLPVHSFRSLLADLATYCRIQATTALNEKYVFTLYSRPTPIQQRAFDLLAIISRSSIRQ